MTRPPSDTVRDPVMGQVVHIDFVRLGIPGTHSRRCWLLRKRQAVTRDYGQRVRARRIAWQKSW